MNEKLIRRMVSAEESLLTRINKSEGLLDCLVLTIIESAARYFDFPGGEDDFCIQLLNDRCIVFGGTNRLKWTAKDSFYPDRSYCSPTFLAHYEKIWKEDNNA